MCPKMVQNGGISSYGNQLTSSHLSNSRVSNIDRKDYTIPLTSFKHIHNDLCFCMSLSISLLHMFSPKDFSTSYRIFEIYANNIVYSQLGMSCGRRVNGYITMFFKLCLFSKQDLFKFAFPQAARSHERVFSR